MSCPAASTRAEPSLFSLFRKLVANGRTIETQMIDSTHVKAHRSAAGEKGEKKQAVGRSRGGRRCLTLRIICIGVDHATTTCVFQASPIQVCTIGAPASHFTSEARPHEYRQGFGRSQPTLRRQRCRRNPTRERSSQI